MNYDQALLTFVNESRELLQEMEDALLELEHRHSEEAVNSIFRAAHTIKGSAGLFGLEPIVAFTHQVETVLDRVRQGELAIDPLLAALLLDCRDQIQALVDAVASGSAPDTATDENLAARLRAYLPSDPEIAGAKTGGAQPVIRPAAGDGAVVESDSWHISLHFGRDTFRNGMDPLSFIQYLSKLGEVQAIATLDRTAPPIEDIDPESCYLGFQIRFRSDALKSEIEEVFEFVRDDCELHILPPKSRIDEYVRIIDSLPEQEMRIGQMLVECGTLTPRELESALRIQSRIRAESSGAPEGHTPLGQILLDEGVVQAPVVEAALKKQRQSKERGGPEGSTIRIQASKLDELINLVGELVIAGASASLLAKRAGNGGLHEATETLLALVEEIRNHALQLRTVEIGVTFNRFRRVVRDVSRELGKEIDLRISGAETELDKSVVEKIGDPLTHLVRNAIDHGIESAAERAERGKPATGTVTLNAFHDSGNIVIEVSDDGRGLQRERIVQKAIERGLAQPDQVLTEQDAFALIFEPGFSTADAVSKLSGRGVGMDVVRKNIEALRGTIEVESREGVGTTIRVRLPLTLAIIDGFLMGVGDAAYVVPLDNVVECLEIPHELNSTMSGRSYLNLRNHALPLIRLNEYFGHGPAQGRRKNIVVVRSGSYSAGLVVDQLMGEFQTVIKPLGRLFGGLGGVSGSTILGSGEVALILDVASLVQHAAANEERVRNEPPAAAAIPNGAGL